jgi:hypothetical protein
MNKWEKFFFNVGWIGSFILLLVGIKDLCRFLDHAMGDNQGLIWIEVLLIGPFILIAYTEDSLTTKKSKMITGIICFLIVLVTFYLGHK